MVIPLLHLLFCMACVDCSGIGDFLSSSLRQHSNLLRNIPFKLPHQQMSHWFHDNVNKVEQDIQVGM